MSDEVRGVLRRQAFGVAYRMLGSVGDAEDVAQEVVLRLVRSPEAPTEPAAWVTTVATRLSGSTCCVAPGSGARRTSGPGCPIRCWWSLTRLRARESGWR